MPPAEPPVDRVTVAAIAAVVYASANVVHELGGHGGTCVAVGGHLEAFSALWQQCDEAGLSDAALRAIAANGTVADLALGLLALAWLRFGSPGPASRYAAWLCAAVTLLQAPGYWLLSGALGVGDWAVVTDGWPFARPILAIGGALGYWWLAGRLLYGLRGTTGGGADRFALARAVLWTSWVAGTLTHVAAGLRDPNGLALVLVSAVGASAGGTSALLWMAPLFRGSEYASDQVGAGVPRSLGWCAAGLGALAVFVGLLGPSVRL